MAESTDPLPRVELAGGYGKRYPHVGHYWINAAIGVAAFLATCRIFHAVLPFPDVPELTPKLHYFVSHKDEFDTLFIGSSHIYRHVIPETFDHVAAEHDVPTRSFNLAIAGMHPPESFSFLDQALRSKPPRLKWVFIELEELYPKWTRENRDTRRFLSWHNWPFTRLAVEEAINPDGRRSWWKTLWLSMRSQTARVHFGMLLKSMANVGFVKDFVDSFFVPQNETANNEQFGEQRGFVPRTHKMPADRVAHYRRQLQERAADVHPKIIDPVTEQGYRDCIRRINHAGAKAVLVVPPKLDQSDWQFLRSAPAPILAFNKAVEFPALYDPQRHVDMQHLTAEGAETFSRLLAERFANQIVSPDR